MEEMIEIPELKEEFHAVMEDIKPKELRELDIMNNSSDPPLLTPVKYIKEENGCETFQEIVTVTDDEDLEEIQILEVINTSDTDPAILSPNYGVTRDQESYDIHRKEMLSVCRLCATRSNGMIHMFDPTEQHRNIIQKIEYCLPIVVKKNDNLSKAACQLCLAKLELSYQFYKTVTEAERVLTIHDETWKTLKEEKEESITEEKDIILEDLNDLAKYRRSSLSNGNEDADSSSNAFDSSNKEVPIRNATTSSNLFSSYVNELREERTRNSNDKRRRIESTSNGLILITKEALVTDATMENNIISSNRSNSDKEGTRSSNNKRRKTVLDSNTLNSSIKKTPITDTTAKKKNIFVIFNNLGEDRAQSSSDESWKTEPSSNISNLTRATLPLNQATSNFVLNDQFWPINSDEEFGPDAFDDLRKKGGDKRHEQSLGNVSEEQLSIRTPVNTHETKHGEQPTVGMYWGKYFDEQYAGESNLLDHMQLRVNEYPFTCPICDKAFKTKGHRNYHIVTHTRTESFLCNSCKASFATKHALRSHQRTIHPRIKREGKAFRSRIEHRSKGADITDAIVQRNVISSNVNNFGEDSSNDERQMTNSSLNASNCRTTETHTTDTTVRNNAISSNFKNLGKDSSSDESRNTNSSRNAVNLSTTILRLKQAISNSALNCPMSPKHSDKELESNDFTPACPQIKTNPQGSGNRRKDEASEQNEKLSCNESQEQFRTQGEINTRERRCKRSQVTRQKPERMLSANSSLKYHCADCGKRSRTKRLILDHILYFHTKERPFKCSVCESTFRTRGQRDNHVMIHSENKPFECKSCGASFRWKGSLVKHREIHRR